MLIKAVISYLSIGCIDEFSLCLNQFGIRRRRRRRCTRYGRSRRRRRRLRCNHCFCCCCTTDAAWMPFELLMWSRCGICRAYKCVIIRILWNRAVIVPVLFVRCYPGEMMTMIVMIPTECSSLFDWHFKIYLCNASAQTLELTAKFVFALLDT